MNPNSVSKSEVNSSETPKHTTNASNSEKTYINPNSLWSTHYIRSLTSDKPNDKSSAQELQKRESLIDSPEKLCKDEIRIAIETEANFEAIVAPAGVFTDKKVRNDFIKKVYAILSLQIVVTTICAGIMYSCFKDKLNFNELKAREDKTGLAVVILLLIASSVIAFTIPYVFCLSVSARRAVPLNFILLGVFTAAWSVLVGIICCQHYGEGILIAFIVTGIVVISITLLATTPWFDITNCGLLLCILVVIQAIAYMVIIGVLAALEVDMKPWIIVLSAIGAFLWTLYLLHDTQLILGGKKYEMNPEEYVFATVVLYVDIIQIFLNILGIVGQSN